MIEAAGARAGERAALHIADMRALPRFGEFDLVWAVNDAVDYLLDGAELQAALTGMRRNLAPGGVVLFDVNTLAAYRSFFGEKVVVEGPADGWVWRGMGSAGDGGPGEVFEARFDGEGAGVEPPTHRQRHFPEEEVLEAIEGAGLSCVEVTGEFEIEPSEGLDEEVHTKAVYVCTKERA